MRFYTHWWISLYINQCCVYTDGVVIIWGWFCRSSAIVSFMPPELQQGGWDYRERKSSGVGELVLARFVMALRLCLRGKYSPWLEEEIRRQRKLCTSRNMLVMFICLFVETSWEPPRPCKIGECLLAIILLASESYFTLGNVICQAVELGNQIKILWDRTPYEYRDIWARYLCSVFYLACPYKSLYLDFLEKHLANGHTVSWVFSTPWVFF